MEQPLTKTSEDDLYGTSNEDENNDDCGDEDSGDEDDNDENNDSGNDDEECDAGQEERNDTRNIGALIRDETSGLIDLVEKASKEIMQHHPSASQIDIKASETNDADDDDGDDH
ncbi:hypothetical protein BGZ51_007175 [Haplosporangium sp. Z 767]|nr:hypothetical protein BGZ51_007175 [Haplosporangium sp. Z 767]